MTIDVSQKWIDIGERNSACGCPIALAASATTKKPCVVPGQRSRVGEADQYFLRYGTPYTDVRLPLIAENFAADFDAGLPIEPFKFDVEILELK